MSDSVQGPKFRVFAALRRFGRVLLRYSLPGIVFVVVSHVGLFFSAFLVLASTYWDYVINSEGKAPPDALVVSLWFGALVLATSTAPPLAAHAADCEQEGRPARFGDAWSVLWRQTPLTMVVQVIQTVMVGLGIILLVIPGIIASVVVSLAVPARVVEGVNPLKAISRSVDLTEGVRWRLFGYQLLTGALVPLLLALGVYALSMGGPAIDMLNTGENGDSPLYIVVSVALAVALIAFIGLVAFVSGLGPAVAYAEIRASSSARAVSDVFD